MDAGKKKQMSLGVLFSYLTIIVQCLSGILYTPIILHQLGQSEYGIYSLCLSFSSYLTIFNGGMNAAFVRFYVQTKTLDENKIPKLNGTFAKIFAVLTILSLVAGIIISQQAELIFGNKILPEEYALLKKAFLILALTTAVTVINCIFSSLVIANERFVFAKLINLLQVIAAPIITIPFLMKGNGVITVFVIKLVLTSGVVLFNLYYCKSKLHTKYNFGGFDRSLIKEISIFSSLIVIQSIMDQLNWQVDKFILARVQGTSEISIYSIGSMFNTYYIMISSVLSGVFIAEINRLVAQKKEKEISGLFIKSSRLFALLVIFVMGGYCIIGKPFILKWAGPEYGQSFWVGLFIMLPVTIPLVMGLAQDITRAKNLHKALIYINVSVSLCNFIISIPLAINYGAVGSAFGTFLAEIFISLIVCSIYYKKVVKLDVNGSYKVMFTVLKGMIIPAIFGITINVFGLVKPSYSSLLLYGVLFVLLYVISIWIFVLNESEKCLVKKLLNRIKRMV